MADGDARDSRTSGPTSPGGAPRRSCSSSSRP